MKICIHPILSQVGTYAISFTKKAQVKLIPLACNPPLQFLFYFILFSFGQKRAHRTLGLMVSLKPIWGHFFY